MTALAGPAGALAHGDPTVHYLETDALLTSYSAPPDLEVELRLRGVLEAAAARGYPIRVVLFASEEDTGGELEPIEDTQTYAIGVSNELAAIGRLLAPVLIVTPDGFGLGGQQPRDGTLRPITASIAAQLTRDLPRARLPEGNALARTATVSVRRLAATGGFPLPKRIAPADHDPRGILGATRAGDGGTADSPWLVAGLLASTALLAGALLLAVHRRLARGPEPDA